MNPFNVIPEVDEEGRMLIDLVGVDKDKKFSSDVLRKIAESDEVKAALQGSIKPIGPGANGSRYYAYGTSYSASAVDGGQTFPEILSGIIGATDYQNGAVPGAISPGLVYEFLQQKPWTPGWQGGLVTIEGGLNDIDTPRQSRLPQQMYNLPENFATAMRYFRAGGVVELSHNSVDTSDFTLGPTTISGVNTQNYFSQTAGATLEIEALSDSDIVLLMFAWRSGSADAAEAHDYEVQVDGGSWRRRTTKSRGDQVDESTNVNTLISERITGLHEGSVIKVRKVGGAGNMRFFPRYLVMNNPNPPRIVIVPDVHVNDGSSPYLNGATNELIDRTIDRLRWLAALPEFSDGTVAVADVNGIFDYTTDISDIDDFHPNLAGRNKIARAVEQATHSLRW